MWLDLVKGVSTYTNDCIQTLIKTHYHMHAGRIVYMVVPIYIAEISPKQKRGRLVSLNFLAMPVGFLVRQITILVHFDL